MNKVLVRLNDYYLLMIIDKLLSDFDDDSMKNMLIDLKILYNAQLLDDIELNQVVMLECNHHVLHNVFLDDLIYYEDDQQNDLNVKVVFVEKYVVVVVLLLLLLLMV